jgi:hypothetical protein
MLPAGHPTRGAGRLPISRRRFTLSGIAAALALGLPATAAARQPPEEEMTVTEARIDPRPVPPAAAPAKGPEFPDVARVEPWDALLFLAGKHPRYARATIESLMTFSPADILETMDTVVLDSVLATRGVAALSTVYRVVATEALEALLALYGGAPLVLALDAGHGGKRGVYYDPGSNGTEAEHARRVVEVIEALAGAPRYASITVRRIFNDAIGDDFLLPPPEDRKSAASLTMRNIRAAMLTAEASLWNAAHPEAAVAVHVLSVHFNAGSGGILVLHQGSSAPPAFVDRSIDYGRLFVGSARPALNRSGLLPYPLALALGTGVSDDRVLYEPMGTMRTPPVNPYTGANRRSFPRRYAMLQTSLLQRDYALGALIYHGLI